MTSLATAPPGDDTTTALDIVGLRDVAAIFGVKARTPTIWAERAESTGFPEPDGYLSGYVPYWRRSRILTWGDGSGRTPVDRAALAPRTGAGVKHAA